MRRIVVTGLSVLLLVASLAAKGPTTRIVITDIARGSVTEITNRAVLEHFQVWAGRGTYSGPPDRQTEGTHGFIVDWTAGAVDERPRQLRRYELKFYVSPKRALPSSVAANPLADELAYVVLYEQDPSTGRGYVYLPGKSDEHFRSNVRTIHRGLEGQWLHASSAWESAFTGLPALR
jgi:hypothetical protein